MKKYELIEHTADVGIKAYGETLTQAFCHAAEAMFSLMTDGSVIQYVETRTIDLIADDLEQLLVDFLSELLYLCDTEGLVFSDFDINIETTQLTGKISGEPFNPDVHKRGLDIKAVTYHMLEVQLTPPIFVQVLLDI